MRNEAYKLSQIASWVRDRNVSCAYDHRFSTSDEKRRGQWWTREQRGMYCPAVSAHEWTHARVMLVSRCRGTMHSTRPNS